MYTKYLSKISCRLPIAFIGCGVLSFTTACNSLTKYGMNDEECTERKANDLDQESNHRPSLLDAARSRNVPLVKQLVSKKGINANETDETGWSPIHWFLFHGDRGLDGLKILLDLVNIDINQKDASGFTPFMKAIISLSCPESFDVLWEKGKDRIQVNEQDEKGLTALHHAIKNNKKNIFDKLLSSEKINIALSDKFGETLLHYAVRWGSKEMLNKLLKEGASKFINKQDTEGFTALHLAVECRSLEMVRLLVEGNADVNVRDKEGMTPLCLATSHCSVEHLDIAKYLIERPGVLDLPDGKGNTAHHNIAAHYDVRAKKGDDNGVNCPVRAMISMLIKKFPDSINATNTDGMTPLHLVAKCGKLKMAEALMGYKGIKIDMPNKDGEAPIHEAIGYDSREVVSYFLNTTVNSTSSLINFVKEQHRPNPGMEEIVDPQDPPLTNIQSYAIYDQYEELEKLLQDKNIDIHERTKKGYTLFELTPCKSYSRMIIQAYCCEVGKHCCGCECKQ